MINKLPVTIKETKEGLMKKKFSAVNLVDEYLARIEKNKGLNAFITVSSEEAYKKAKQIDLSLQDLPLLGVTVAHKDLFLTKGVRTTAGSKVLESYVPVYSATVVERMEKAGAIMIGKTNCDAWAHGASGENSDFGPTLNPNNKDYVPGGSSSGSAAAVSAGLTLIATGIDTGGSIRQPANFCGVVGLKPTYGSISRHGLIAMASSLDQIGPITKTVEDAAILFESIKGKDLFDATSVNNYELQTTNYELNDIKKLKIGLPKEYFTEGIDKNVSNAIEKSINSLKSLGFEFKEISLPNTKYALSCYYIIMPAEVSSNLARFDGIRYAKINNSELKIKNLQDIYLKTRGEGF